MPKATNVSGHPPLGLSKDAQMKIEHDRYKTQDGHGPATGHSQKISPMDIQTDADTPKEQDGLP